MSYIGSWKIDDLLTFVANTTRVDTGVATDADAVATYRVYEDETGTPILTGSMALLDSANTAGFYSEQITLSAANGFEKGKCYSIYIAATVNSIAGATHRTFQIEAEVDANTVSGTVLLTNPQGIVKNTAVTGFQFPMYTTAGVLATGVTVTEERSIDGGAFAAMTNNSTEIGTTGIYQINLSAADTNGNFLLYKMTATGCVTTVIGPIRTRVS